MLADIIDQHSGIISSWNVSEFDRDGTNFRMKARVRFVDNSVLVIRQIVLGSSKYKYAYQWQDKHNRLIIRWDNAPHWKDIETFPCHKHISDNDNPLADSSGGDLSLVFAEIAKKLH